MEESKVSYRSRLPCIVSGEAELGTAAPAGPEGITGILPTVGWHCTQSTAALVPGEVGEPGIVPQERTMYCF